MDTTVLFSGVTIVMCVLGLIYTIARPSASTRNTVLSAFGTLQFAVAGLLMWMMTPSFVRTILEILLMSVGFVFLATEIYGDLMVRRGAPTEQPSA